MLGVGYADIFNGTLCVCGVNFYQNVPTLDQKFFPATYVPDPGVVLLARRSGRFAGPRNAGGNYRAPSA